MTLSVPSIKVSWLRGHGRIPFKKPLTILALGLKESGKSNFIEACSIRYLENGRVYDLFGSRDNEGLAWCRVIPKEDVLFVTGDSVEIKGKWHSVAVKDLYSRYIQKHRVVISVSAFYGDRDEEFYGMTQIVDKHLYRRTHWKTVDCLLCRELANFIYARIAQGKNQDLAKADFIYCLRESRHVGLTFAVDTIRWTSIDKEIRDVADFQVIKRVGTQGLPNDLKYLYSFIVPPLFMNPPPNVFFIIDNRGPIGIGKFDYVKWHKKEKDDLLTELGITPKYGDVPDYGDKQKGWLSDYEHRDIIGCRREGLSMHKIADRVHRSSKTVNDHIKDHNRQVQKRGYCVKCRRVKGVLDSIEV